MYSIRSSTNFIHLPLCLCFTRPVIWIAHFLSVRKLSVSKLYKKCCQKDKGACENHYCGMVFSVNVYFQPLFILCNDINNSVFRYSTRELYMNIYCSCNTVWNVSVVPAWIDLGIDFTIKYSSRLRCKLKQSLRFQLSFSSRPFEINMVKCRRINIARFALWWKLSLDWKLLHNISRFFYY